VKNSKERANKVWAAIKHELDPIPPSRWQSTTMNSLAGMFKNRTFGSYISKSDPAIREEFQGMPELKLDNGRSSEVLI